MNASAKTNLLRPEGKAFSRWTVGVASGRWNLNLWGWGIAFLLIAVGSLGMLPAVAQAQERTLGKFNEWSAHTYQEDGSIVCNMFSKPIRHEEGGKRRGEIVFFVTHRPSKNQLNVAALAMGYPLEDGVDSVAEIGGQSFAFESEGEVAFGYEREVDALIAAMRVGSRLVVQGLSQRNTRTVDTYSLSGFTAAHNAINQACKVR